MREEPAATIDDLFRVEGKAELVRGKIVREPPAGALPGFAGDEIFASLRVYAFRSKRGQAAGSTRVYRVHLPHRGSISPDVGYFKRAECTRSFFEGAPVFAVEVRDVRDYGAAAERTLAEKRADYFASGTLVVWDVDLLSEDVIRAYRAADPRKPSIYRRGDIANAEPAVPGWTLPVADLFEEE